MSQKGQHLQKYLWMPFPLWKMLTKQAFPKLLSLTTKNKMYCLLSTYKEYPYKIQDSGPVWRKKNTFSNASLSILIFFLSVVSENSVTAYTRFLTACSFLMQQSTKKLFLFSIQQHNLVGEERSPSLQSQLQKIVPLEIPFLKKIVPLEIPFLIYQVHFISYSGKKRKKK